MRILKTFLFLAFLSGTLSGNAQKILWQKCIGGSGYDNGMKMIPVEHNCFILGGTTSSTNGLGEGNHSADNFDFVVTKVSAEGHVIWKSVIGGSGKETFGDMKLTPDGGLVLIGTSDSKDGDAKGNHGKMDLMVAKLDLLGRLEWSQCYGGHGNDKGTAIIPIEGGGYLIGGESGSNTGDMKSHKGGLDSWVARLNQKGEVQIQKTLGGRGNEKVNLLHEPKPGRYMVISTTTSTGGDIKDPLGAKDVWIVTLSRNFDIVWSRCYGGSDFDEPHAIISNHRDELVLAGTTFSEDEDLDLSTNHGLGDSWLFMITHQGNLAWSQTYGGSKSDGGNGVSQTPDGGYIMVGTSNSKDKLVPINKGLYDGWIVRTDSMGRKIWQGTFGGEDFEYLYDVHALEDGNYLALGFAESVRGDLAPTGKEVGNDFWFFRFGDPEDPIDNVLRSGNYVTGALYSKSSEVPLLGTAILTNNKSMKEIKTTKTDYDRGIYEMDLPDDGQYSLMLTAPGYMFYGQDIDYSQFTGNPEMRIDAYLSPILPGSKVALRNIYFDIGKYDLKSESEPELYRLLKFMQLNPKLKIEISGHTDNTGNQSSKKELSLRRATRVRDWLLKKGIPGRNMQVAGYGAERPEEDNESEEGRARNRRVEVEVVELL